MSLLYDNLGVQNGHLTFCGYDTAALAQQHGTPLMLLDEQRIRNRCRAYLQAMSQYLPEGSHPMYASKALSIKRIYEIMAEEGMGVDVVSRGELYTAVKAGFPMERACFHGNSKTDEDILFAMEHGIGSFVCDGMDELAAVNTLAAGKGIRQKVLLRLAPGIDPHTHEKISTGRIDCKFGTAIETGQAEEFVRSALTMENIDMAGYHCHIGSQIFEAEPFYDAVRLMLQFVALMGEKYGYYPRELDIGGGMGVPYTKADEAIDYGENIRAIGECDQNVCRELNLQPPAIVMEPGRSIVADAGMTLYHVTAIKEIPGFKNYVAVNGGMADNPRYALYNAEYTVLAADRMEDKTDFLCTVAGCCCESGDLLQEDVCLPKMRRGDLLAVLTTGAYNYSMASNYNRIPRPPIVVIGENGPYTAVRRESLDDLLKCDT
ncbi:MAG: diaminopimelate decarboxylase [Oscillospiraceae bacterium]|nr:diaminopimelate decarboxylase [Oscillospiraceae bacterium]